MNILALTSQKGGSGKTTLAGHLSVAAEAAGAGPVAVIDTDPPPTAENIPFQPGDAALSQQDDGALPIIEVRAEDSEPKRSRALPSVQARTPETIGATTSRDSCAAPSAIIDLWEHLVANRLRPTISDVDPVTIAGQWPNPLLVRVTQGGRRPGLEVAHMFAPPAGGPTSAIPIDAMTVDWIVSLGREVVITGGPVHETDAVPTAAGPISCGATAPGSNGCSGDNHPSKPRHDRFLSPVGEPRRAMTRV